MMYPGRMDGSEPGLTSATSGALGSLLSTPLSPLWDEGAQGPPILAFLAGTLHRHVSETHRKPPPGAQGCRKAEGGRGGGGEKSFI